MPVCWFPFSSSPLAKLLSGLPSGPIYRTGMPHAVGRCWLFHQAYLPLKINALDPSWKNQSLGGSWGN